MYSTLHYCTRFCARTVSAVVPYTSHWHLRLVHTLSSFPFSGTVEHSLLHPYKVILPARPRSRNMSALPLQPSLQPTTILLKTPTTSDPRTQHIPIEVRIDAPARHPPSKHPPHSPMPNSTTSTTTPADVQPPSLPPGALALIIHSFLSFLICNIDRINLSVTVIPMSAQYKWTNAQAGLVQSIFFLGYMTTAILGGRLADIHGGRPVLAIAVTLWSICTILTPLAAALGPGLIPLLVMRVALGAGEGAAMPSMNAIIATAVPPHFRARALSFIYSGMYAGSISGLLATPPILKAAGFPAVFYVFGAIGIIWVMLFLLTTTNPTSSHSNTTHQPVTSNTHADVQLESTPLSIDPQKHNPNTSNHHDDNHVPPLRELLSSGAVWTIIVAHFCSTWGYFVLVAWLPTYFSQRFGQDISASALYSAAPWAAMFVAANAGGAVADWLLRRGVDTTTVRKIMQGVGFLGPAMFLAAVASVDRVSVAVPLVAMAVACSSWSQSGLYSNHQDIGPNIAGTLLGISNTFASIPGLVGVYVTGVVLDLTGKNWNAVFFMAIFFYMLGFIVYTSFATAERIW